nr:penicillin acylase family protein [Xanthomonas arboricola]
MEVSLRTDGDAFFVQGFNGARDRLFRLRSGAP